MALAATTIWEVKTTGSDTLNGGAFDPGQTAGMFTDGAATVATGNSPVFTSASYNFLAGDVGAWVFIASGTNWTKGWYKIASVAANAATLSAAIGAAVGGTTGYRTPNTVAGCATTASPTGATWSIDYSQQAAAQFAYTDLASVGAGLAVSSAAKPFAKQQVGNSIRITGGTNFTVGNYVIASVAVAVATVVGPGNITTGAGVNGTGGQGGALLSPAIAAAKKVAQNDVYITAGTYSQTSTSTNVAAGMILENTGGADARFSLWQGYSTVRGDLGTKPLIQASGAITGFTQVNATSGKVTFDNLSIDSATKATSAGMTAVGAVDFVRCKVANCAKNGIETATDFNNGAVVFACEVTGCTDATFAFKGIQTVGNTRIIGCYVHDNVCIGIEMEGVAIWTISETNATGFRVGTNSVLMNCVAYANAGQGFNDDGNNGRAYFINCLAYGQTSGGLGFNLGAAMPKRLINCAGGNNAGGNFPADRYIEILNFVALTADPFTNAAAGDFSLNNVAGGGTAVRAAGYPGIFPGGLSTGYLDIGAVQHQGISGGIAILGGSFSDPRIPVGYR